jgi:murein L,D-transpeptidase YcbB/YkuD
MHLLKFFPDHIKDMNIPVGKRIKHLLLIWNAVDGYQMTSQIKELIAINIPAYQLTYF